MDGRNTEFMNTAIPYLAYPHRAVQVVVDGNGVWDTLYYVLRPDVAFYDGTTGGRDTYEYHYLPTILCCTDKCVA